MSCSSLRRSGKACVNEGSHSFTCHPHVSPQVEWPYLPVLPSHRASPYFGWYSFPTLLRVGGWVGLGGLMKYWGGLPARRWSVAHCNISRDGQESNSRPLSRESTALTIQSRWQVGCWVAGKTVIRAITECFRGESLIIKRCTYRHFTAYIE